jgi:hypothetical protein
MNMNPAIKIKADILWAFTDKPNEMSGKYQIDLCNLSDRATKELEKLGIEVRSKEGQGHFITCKSNKPIRVYDDGGSILDGVVIGNGSKAVAAVSFYEWSFKGKKGVSPALRKLVITDLVEYSPDGGALVGMDEDDAL